MKVYYVNFDEAAQRAKELIAAGEEGLMVAVSDSLAFAIGAIDNTCDRQKIQELGGTVYEGQWRGGTCVVFPQDVSLCQIAHTANDLGERCMMAVQQYLRSTGLMIRRAGNDLLLYEKGSIVGKKVASFGDAWKEVSGDNKYFETVVHVSIGTDNAVIKQVCTKRMEKEPAALKDYGITPEGVVAYLKQHLTELK